MSLSLEISDLYLPQTRFHTEWDFPTASVAQLSDCQQDSPAAPPTSTGKYGLKIAGSQYSVAGHILGLGYVCI